MANQGNLIGKMTYDDQADKARMMGRRMPMNNAPRLKGNLLGAPHDLGPKKFIPYRKGGRQ